MPSVDRDEDAAGDEQAGGPDARVKDEEGAHANDGDGKIRLMSGSGQSKQDRQDLRRRQRALKDDIFGLPDDTVVGMRKCRERNNTLWREVRYPKEATLDSDLLGMIADRSAAQADKLVTTPRYDAVRLAEQLRKKGSVRTSSGRTKKFAWRSLGIQVGVCFNALPSNISFLHGPLERGYTPPHRKKRRRQYFEEEDGEEEHPDKIDQDRKHKVQDHELSAVGRNIRRVRHALDEKSREQRESILAQQEDYIARISEGKECDETAILREKQKLAKEASRVDAIDALFDKESFTQTVENIYNISFDVFHGFAGIGLRKLEDAERYREAGIEGLGPGPVVYPVRTDPHGNKQAILSLNMEQWRRLTRPDSHYLESKAQGSRRTAPIEGSNVVSQTESAYAYSGATAASAAAASATAVTPEKEIPSRSRTLLHSTLDEEPIMYQALPYSDGEESLPHTQTESNLGGPKDDPKCTKGSITPGKNAKTKKRKAPNANTYGTKRTRESNKCVKNTKTKKRKDNPSDHQRTLDSWVKPNPDSKRAKVEVDYGVGGSRIKKEERVKNLSGGSQKKHDEVVCIDLCEEEEERPERVKDEDGVIVLD